MRRQGASSETAWFIPHGISYQTPALTPLSKLNNVMWTLNLSFPSTRSWTNKLKRFGLRTYLWRSHLMNKLRKSPNYRSMYHLRSLLIHNKMLSFSSCLEKQSKLLMCKVISNYSQWDFSKISVQAVAWFGYKWMCITRHENQNIQMWWLEQAMLDVTIWTMVTTQLP